MTREHRIVTFYAAATCCLGIALIIRGCWLFDNPVLATADVLAGIVAYRFHIYLQRFERFADEG